MDQRMAWLRQEVEDRLNPKLAKRGANQHTGGGYIVTSSRRGNRESYTLRRLKRDNPTLAKRVIDGELSANAAAIQAGIRRKTITVPLDPERAAATLARHFTPDELDALIEALGEVVA